MVSRVYDSEHVALNLGGVLEIRIARAEEVAVTDRLGGSKRDYVRVQECIQAWE